MISRWAWERKGRPQPLKETLPFVAVSIGAGVILTLASKFGNGVAKEMGLDGAARVVVADMFYFAANCLTFALRFLIFHFVLFADRNAKVDTLAVVEGRAPVTDEPVESLITSEPARADVPPAHPPPPAGPARCRGDGVGAGQRHVRLGQRLGGAAGRARRGRRHPPRSAAPAAEQTATARVTCHRWTAAKAPGAGGYPPAPGAFRCGSGI